MSRSNAELTRFEELREEHPEASEDYIWELIRQEAQDSYWDAVDRGRQRAKDEGWR